MAACGSDKKDQTLSKAEVIKRGSAICKAVEKKVARLPEIKSKNPFGKGTTAADHRNARIFIAGYADLLDSSRRGLQALKAPSQDKKLLDGYLSDIGRVAAVLRQGEQADTRLRLSQGRLRLRLSELGFWIGFPA